MKRLKNKTKIVATIGPASSSRETLREMILEGVNVCRINFSHGTHEQHAETIRTIRSLDEELGAFTAILGDLQGPKIRIGEVEGGTVELQDGQRITITTKESKSTASRIFISYETFAQDVKPGERVLVDDGKLVLEIESTNGVDEAEATVLYGGPLSSRKGVNLPNTLISLPSLTKKDRKDLVFALEQDIHWIGLSFVRSPEDITDLRSRIEEAGRDCRIIAKIEKPEAIEHLDAIIKETDGVMVARGDLGVEIPMQELPLFQKEIVKKCQRAAKPVIIATQMMETMITNISPTRAEVNDVANAVLDGADAVMLSGETSVGKHPVEVIKAMYKIVTEIESYEGIYHQEFEPDVNEDRFLTDNICFSSVRLSKRTQASAILTMTFSGYTGFKIASFRPKSNIFVFTGNARLLNVLGLVWGTRGFYYDAFVSTDQTTEDIKTILRERGFVEEDDLVIHIASMPIANKGMTNMLRLSYV